MSTLSEVDVLVGLEKNVESPLPETVTITIKQLCAITKRIAELIHFLPFLVVEIDAK